MMRYAALRLVPFMAAGCGTGEPRYQHQALASLEFTLPVDWKMDVPRRPAMWKGKDWKLRGLETAQWTPSENYWIGRSCTPYEEGVSNVAADFYFFNEVACYDIIYVTKAVHCQHWRPPYSWSPGEPRTAPDIDSRLEVQKKL